MGWDASKHPRGPGGKFAKLSSALSGAAHATDGKNGGRKSSGSSLATLAGKLSGRESHAELDAHEARMGLPKSNGSRAQRAQRINDHQFHQTEGGARLFSGFGGGKSAKPKTSKSKPASSGEARPGMAALASDWTSQPSKGPLARATGPTPGRAAGGEPDDLAGLSARQLRGIAERENIPVGPKDTRAQVANHIRANRHRRTAAGAGARHISGR